MPSFQAQVSSNEFGLPALVAISISKYNANILFVLSTCNHIVAFLRYASFLGENMTKVSELFHVIDIIRKKIHGLL